MAVSNVNILWSSFSYCSAVTSSVDAFDIFTKFLVTGGDPLGIESITVTDKIARVVTVEKNFFSVPGAKLLIAGTNVGELDGRRELSAVFTDGFSFETEASDGSFTNGLTYAIAPLGWSLVFRSTSRIIYKSGTSALKPFYITFEETGNFYNMFMCYEENGEYMPFKRIPINSPDSYQYLYGSIPAQSWFTYFPASSNFNFKFVFYGDDSYVLFGGELTATTINPSNKFHDTGRLSWSVFGESRSNNNTSILVISGWSTSTSYPSNSSSGGGYLTSQGTATILSGIKLETNYIFFSLPSLNDNVLSFPCYSSCLISGPRSGYRKTTNHQYNSNRNRVVKNELITPDRAYVCDLPGSWLIDYITPGMESSSLSPFTLISENNKKRRAVSICLSTVTSNISTIYTATKAYSILDLTGPIR